MGWWQWPAMQSRSRTRAHEMRAVASVFSRIAPDNRRDARPREEAQRERGCLRNRPRQKPRPLERFGRERQVVVDLELIADAEERRVRGEEGLASDQAGGRDVAHVINGDGLIGIVEEETLRRRIARGLRQRREESRPFLQHGRVLDGREATRDFLPVHENRQGDERQDELQSQQYEREEHQQRAGAKVET